MDCLLWIDCFDLGNNDMAMEEGGAWGPPASNLIQGHN